ncbi:MAG: hypothetical protein NTY04_02545 [Candidatus Staskawiczbacteria bacterium]|nr:hypothetical protein [Candidatus Staskawiczbacteria bacterium]
MAEQQLIDYIKKAREAGQADDQTRNLLLKNGWTTAEVSEAFTSLNQPAQPAQPQVIIQPKIEAKPQVQAVKAQPQVQVKPQFPIQTQKPQDNMSKTKTGSHLGLKLLMVAVIIIVLGGVVFAVGKYINVPWNPFRPKPETVISNMIKNMTDLKSSHTAAKLEISAVDNKNNKSQGKLTLDTNSEVDLIDANNLKSDGNFTINLTVPGNSSPYISCSATAVVVDGVVYIKFTNIVLPDEFSHYMGIDISKLKGNWFAFDQSSAGLLSQAGVIPPGISVDTKQASTLSTQIKNLILAENIFSVTKQLEDQTIGGQDAYHYAAVIKIASVKDLVNKIIALSAAQNANTDTSLIQAVMGAYIDVLGDTNIEMWIGKKDYMLYQYNLDKIVDLSKMAGGAKTTIEIKSNGTNSNFDKPISVSKPKSQKIEDFIAPLIKNQQITSDLSQIGKYAQTLFSSSKSYQSFCIKGLLNGYLKGSGKELVGLNNDIISQGAGKPACFSSAKNVCVSTKLSDGTYMCVGINNALGSVQCASAQTVCK